MNILFRLVVVVVTLAALCASGPADAQQATCSVNSSAISFGTYDPLSSQSLDTSGRVTVTCQGLVGAASVNYTITLGTGGSGDFSPRRMTSGTSTLSYNLYTNGARTNTWGDGTGSTATILDGYTVGLSPASRDYDVYARVPGRQNVASGAYADSILVTVIY